ncbi:serine/threonine-protein kinase [Skeletonema marinoi]|uniref:Serine/threonine-protein kinase n=1 Tax=Skeletonema marinoi TaxID=267567 RepID=A0AAD9DDS0_9STRA|nr:serine/threonine-protein kinase [Skeletonema marinoi]|mmetsp:Transcript_20011/g.40117  ORF Transcript_20011/g.40117 Transcript_20011/m.40117 type:complete len:397 (+) Transcript_20011:354-1544(+)|eukprot:scaffold19081_cov136-Skeletonema_marinoi.AAC.9
MSGGSMQVMSSHYDNRAKGGATYQSSQQYHGGYEAGADKQRRSKPSSQRRDASPTTQGNFGFAGVANNVTPPSPTPDVGSSTAAQSQLDATQRRPAYLLHRDLVIGKGSYGQVCIASRGEAEGMTSSKAGKRKKFACKCVLLRSDPKYIAKLQEEVNVLRELRGHDNVIRLYDVFCVDNELFIITELGRGGDLFHLLTTHPKHGVTEAYAAKTVSEMLSAVAFLHTRHICHRDLKLENWVLESGKDVWSKLKLIDFGLSTHFTPGHKLSRVVGSSYYVAPEVLKKSYTEACDLWSLGVIVYMLLSGAPPFYGKNDEAIKSSIVHGEYSFPHELFRDVSEDAMAFVSCLLSYSIEYRYTAEQALTHPWLKAHCAPEQLQRCKIGAKGHHDDPDAMQM